MSRLGLHCPGGRPWVVYNNRATSGLDHRLLLAGHPIVFAVIDSHVLSALNFIHLRLWGHQKVSLRRIAAFSYFASTSNLLALKLLNTYHLAGRSARHMLCWLASNRDILGVRHKYLALGKLRSLLLLLIIDACASGTVFQTFRGISELIAVGIWEHIFVCLDLLFKVLELLLDVVLAAFLLDGNCVGNRPEWRTSYSVHLLKLLGLVPWGGLVSCRHLRVLRELLLGFLLLGKSDHYLVNYLMSRAGNWICIYLRS